MTTVHMLICLAQASKTGKNAANQEYYHKPLQHVLMLLFCVAESPCELHFGLGIVKSPTGPNQMSKMCGGSF